MGSRKQLFFCHENLKSVPAGEGATRQVMGFDKDMMMVRVAFSAGSTGIMHTHPHIQATYVSKGRFEVTIGGESQVLSAGDGFFVPPDVPHGVLCLKDGILVDVFTPAREDFLK